jgi:hypothetical protein
MDLLATTAIYHITCIRQLVVELGSTDRGSTNSLKARELLVRINSSNIESDEEFFFGFE